MKNLYEWIDANITILEESVRILREQRDNIDKVIIQSWATKKHVDAMVDFLERKKKFG